MIMTSSSNTPSSKVSFKTDKSTQPTYRTQPSLNSLSIVSKVSTTPSENLNACVEEPNSQQDNEKIMSASGMVRRTRDLPQQRSDFHVADRQPDEEWSKKRAHSRYCLWLHRRHAFLNSQWRLPVVSISCTIGTICMFYALLRISDYHSPKNRLIGEYPRCVYFADSQSELGGESLLLEPKMEDYRSDRVIFEPMSKPEAQAHLQESKDYKKGHMQNFESESCKAQYKWQLTSFPTCNTVYEFDLTHIFDSMTGDPRARLLANGFWRDVWSVREEASNATRVLKTMRYKHPYTERNFDRHRRDAIAMERLTKSNFVVDIYGFCGNSGLFEFADGGDIKDALFPRGHKKSNMTQLDKLRIATQASIGLAAVHNVDKEGQASIAHTDISPSQFIQIDGIYKLNDFNRARFLRRNNDKDEACPYYVGKNPGKNRSPEEYEYKPQSEKVDVYSLGNIFYMLLMSEWPFQDVTVAEAQASVKEGQRPSFYADIWNSTDPVEEALRDVMFMCHEQEPDERSTARQVEDHLKAKLKELDPGRLEQWDES